MKKTTIITAIAVSALVGLATLAPPTVHSSAQSVLFRAYCSFHQKWRPPCRSTRQAAIRDGSIHDSRVHVTKVLAGAKTALVAPVCFP